MDKLKQYVVFAVLGCLGVLAAGWFLLVSPKNTEAADLRSQADTQVGSNATLETQLASLKARAKELPKQQAKLAAIAARIPDNPALPAVVRALTTAATSNGVELISLTPAPPAVVGAATAAAPAAPAAPGAAPAAPAAGTTAGQLAQIGLTLNVIGGYFQVEKFIAAIENLPRSMRITTVSIAPGANPLKKAGSSSVDDGKTLSATITGQVYMAANRPPALAVTIPGQTVTGTGAGPVAPVTPAKK
jgi:Tfp pilus assembly protein PilO